MYLLRNLRHKKFQMKKINCLSFVLLSLTFLSIHAFGQTGSGIGSFSFSPGTKNLPYSAEFTTESVRRFGDDNKITQVYTRLESRDGEGRTRTETTRPTNVNYPAESSTTTITVSDPIAGYFYVINPANKTVYRSLLNPPRSVSPLVNPLAAHTGYSVQRENLGSRIIEDLEATGIRSTTTLAPGAVGNEKEFKTTYETWTSTKLRITLLTISDDPRNGTTTTRVTKIRLDEPDKSLFELPADYRIVDQPTE